MLTRFMLTKVNQVIQIMREHTSVYQDDNHKLVGCSIQYKQLRGCQMHSTSDESRCNTPTISKTEQTTFNRSFKQNASETEYNTL